MPSPSPRIIFDHLALPVDVDARMALLAEATVRLRKRLPATAPGELVVASHGFVPDRPHLARFTVHIAGGECCDLAYDTDGLLTRDDLDVVASLLRINLVGIPHTPPGEIDALAQLVQAPLWECSHDCGSAPFMSYAVAAAHEQHHR